MSAYICNPEHIGILAAYATLNGHSVWNNGDRILTAQDTAKELAKENIRSVATRYPDDKDGQRPGPCLLDADILEAAAIYAAHFIKHPQKPKPVQVLKLVQSLDYQSCETDDWKDTLAYRQLQWITSHAISTFPGYDDAAWSFDQPLPEIEALYEKEN